MKRKYMKSGKEAAREGQIPPLTAEYKKKK